MRKSYMRRQPKAFEAPQSLSEWIILIAVTGVVLTSPYGGKAIVGLVKAYLDEKVREKKIQEEFEKRNISQALYRLKKRKIIQIKRKGNKVRIILTEKGRLKKLAYDIERIRVPQPKIWDGQWRFLIFDIPAGRALPRDAFRHSLKRLGFIQFQKSVWIYPYPCEEEVDFLAEYFKVRRFLSLLTVKIEKDEPLKKSFSKLKL